MSISSLSSLATTAFDTARSTLKAMADAATAPPTDAAKTPAAKPDAGQADAGTTAADLGSMTQDTVEVSTAKTPAEDSARVAAKEAPVRPRSRLGNALDSYA